MNFLLLCVDFSVLNFNIRLGTSLESFCSRILIQGLKIIDKNV